MKICDWTSERLRAAAQRFNLACAKRFGKFVEVDTPTLSYRAYLWRDHYWFV